MIPGESRDGSVRIGNTGDVAGAFTLSSSDLTDTPGPNGGRLSDVLTLRIVERGGGEVYTGPFKSMPDQDLGSWAAGEEHTYDFTVTFPQGGQPGSNTTGDNAFEGSTSSITFNWDAVSE